MGCCVACASTCNSSSLYPRPCEHAHAYPIHARPATGFRRSLPCIYPIHARTQSVCAHPCTAAIWPYLCPYSEHMSTLPGSDLAILRVDDDEFWKDLHPLHFGGIPRLQDRVCVYVCVCACVCLYSARVFSQRLATRESYSPYASEPRNWVI